jgi:Xaa-Pro aminopeptidase
VTVDQAAAAGPSTPAPELDARVRELQRSLQARAFDGALILQNADLFYYAGTVQQSYLYVPAQGEPTLFVRRVLERARAESALATVVPLASPKGLAEALLGRYGALPQRLGLELDVLPVNRLQKLQELLPGITPVDVSPDIVQQRSIKSEHEIGLLRESAALGDAICARLPDLLEEGLSEAEFAGRVEAQARALGHEGIIRMRGFNQEMFYGQLLVGLSGAVASFLDTPLGGSGLSAAVAQGVSMRRIGRGEPIVFDFVPVRNGYITDFTRIFSLGRLPDELRLAYGVALQVQDAVVEVARPGVTCSTLYEAAVAAAERAGLAEHFMGHGPTRVRFVGHGVGLELDELPVIAANDTVLEPGMVFALEPKFVFPGLGAVGIENTWCVRADGLERLTLSSEELRELA